MSDTSLSTGFHFLKQDPKYFSTGDLIHERYQVVQRIADGSYSDVYLVVDTEDQRDYALKVINLGEIKQNVVENLVREIKIHSSLDHPRIIQLINYFEVEIDLPATNSDQVTATATSSETNSLTNSSSNSIRSESLPSLPPTPPSSPEQPEMIHHHLMCLLMEYAPLGELMDKIPPRGFSELQAARYLYQVAQAFRHLHYEKQVIHRDLKPENLFLDAQGQIKVGDFGFSTYFQPGELHTRLCGTPEYLPPEVILQHCHDEKLDIWAMGVLLYEFLVKKNPFIRYHKGGIRNTVALYQNIVANNWSLPGNRQFSPEVIDLLKKLLEPDPEQRPNIGTVLQHPWFQILSKSNAAKPVLKRRNSLLGRLMNRFSETKPPDSPIVKRKELKKKKSRRSQLRKISDVAESFSSLNITEESNDTLTAESDSLKRSPLRTTTY